uniref:Uncharacterized protein n=1 Tax=Rhizophora mucronata TaxID=61149 RepID=A0A2P2J5B0_RHIMU
MGRAGKYTNHQERQIQLDQNKIRLSPYFSGCSISTSHTVTTILHLQDSPGSLSHSTLRLSPYHPPPLARTCRSFLAVENRRGLTSTFVYSNRPFF